MEIKEYLMQFTNGVTQGITYNQISAKPKLYAFNDVDIKQFNEIYQLVYKSDMNIIKRTEKGSIMKGPNAIANDYAYDLVKNKTGCRLTIIIDGKVFVFKIGVMKDKEMEVSPIKAWLYMIEKLENAGIDIYDYKIDNGLEVKKTIESPLIYMNQYMSEKERGLENCHHIDFHNSYPAGLCNTHEEFRKVIEPIYKDRKTNKINKTILNEFIGCMQSDKYPWYAQWSHLSRDAIKDNNTRIKNLAFQLELTGHKILGFNTDGIWYQGKIYHGQGEGTNLGEWENDHINCIFRSKTDGCYEFIENGEYHPVVRGLTNYDSVKPNRDEWQWGDIYKDETVRTYKFEEGVGIIYE